MVIETLPLDTTGSAPSNLVSNEGHPIGTSKVFVADKGAFFTRTLKLTQGGKPLIRGVDWKPIIYVSSAGELIPEEIHQGWVLNEIKSTEPIIAEYQAVGDKWASYSEAILQYIEHIGLEKELFLYGDLVGVPTTFPPGPHKTEGKDLIGMYPVVEALASLTNAVLTGSSQRISQLESIVADKLGRDGNRVMVPHNGTFHFNDTMVAQDIAIERSETQDATVILEVLFISDGRPYRGVFTYIEEWNAMGTLNGYFLGSVPPADRILIGVAAYNENKTILRIGGTDKICMEVLFINSISTTDTIPNEKYKQVTPLENTLSLDIPLQEIVMVSSGATTVVIRDILDKVDVVTAELDEAKAQIEHLNSVIGNNTEY